MNKLTFKFENLECDNFMEDYQNSPFYTSIQNGFLNFQKALNEEWKINSLFLIILSFTFITKTRLFSI